MLTFNEDCHEYAYAGRKIPGVTSVLAPYSDFSMVPKDVLEDARKRGQAVHKMVELEVRDELDEDDLPGWLDDYLFQWRRFRVASGLVVLYSERRVYSAKYGYAGTLDLVATVNGRRSLLLPDVKSGVTMKTAGPQTAAYLQALGEELPELAGADRRILTLTDKKCVLSEPYRSPRDLKTFLAALHLYNEGFFPCRPK